MLQENFSNSNYGDSIVSAEAKADVESHIVLKDIARAKAPYITCYIRNELVGATPKELVRQLMLYTLQHKYGYNKSSMSLDKRIPYQDPREEMYSDIESHTE